MKIKHIAAISIFMMLLSLSGCISMKTNATGIGQTALPHGGREYEVVGESKGQSSSYKFLWLIPVTPKEDINRAIKQAIGEKGGDNLINVCYWEETQVWLLGLGTVKVLYVQGDVIRYID